jgi:hypothetical protein
MNGAIRPAITAVINKIAKISVVPIIGWFPYVTLRISGLLSMYLM